MRRERSHGALMDRVYRRQRYVYDFTRRYYLIGRDDLIHSFVLAGLDAIEAHHSKHTAEDTARYLELAAHHHLAVSGGSDYHGDPSHDVVGPGAMKAGVVVVMRGGDVGVVVLLVADLFPGLGNAAAGGVALDEVGQAVA